MTYNLGQRSMQRLDGVHPDLIRVVKRAIQISSVDFMVVEGVRSREQCLINWGKGRTKEQLMAKGLDAKYAQPTLNKVTWLANPLNSMHCKNARTGFGHAVDLLPAPYDWKSLADFEKVANAMLQAAVEQTTRIRWGANWDGDKIIRERGETDNPHFELMGY